MSDLLDTALCRRLGCRYPIIQTAMGWVARPELVGASCNAGAFGFLGFDLKPSVLKRELRRRDGELDEPPHLLDFFLFDVDGGVEALYLARDLACELRCVEGGNPPDSALPFLDCLPDLFRADSDRRQHADTGNYHSAFQN